MRRVTGPTDRVVVVGAGLGGLSAALHLAGAGREVIVVEREDAPGGRAGSREVDSYRFDTGPTVLTMPSLLADAFRCVDEELNDWLALTRLDPAYRAFFADGTQLDVHTDVDRMAASIQRECGARDADGYLRFVTFARTLFEIELPHFMDRNIDSPADALTPQLLRLVRMGGLRRLAPTVASYFADPRLRRLFSFQALYAGVSPYDALALYASISYMDTVAGVYQPDGGMTAIPHALASAAAKHGVDFRFGTAASSVEMRGSRAVAVLTNDGERIPTDVVVLNPDLLAAWDLLPPGCVPKRLRRLRFAPSCFLLHVGTKQTYSRAARHNLHFGAAWKSSFDELFHRGELMSDPSLMVTHAPEAGTLACLTLTPNLAAANIDWDVIAPRFRDETVARLEQAGYVGLADATDVELVTTPADWARRGLGHGSPFGPAHSFGQTGPFRPGNIAFDNVVFAGCGTHPGSGIPTVLISGRLAAERIIGRPSP